MKTKYLDCNQRKLEERAMRRLISLQKCTKVKDDSHTIPCFGPDINGLDYSRKWIYEEQIKRGVDSEHARISANKLVLYVNEDELKKTAAEIYNELLKQAEQRVRKEKGIYFSIDDLKEMVAEMLV